MRFGQATDGRVAGHARDGGLETWEKVKEGVPPGGDFVPEGLPGINYKSPGYVAKQ